MNVLSLGAGVQSTTVALLAAEGRVPPIDVAVFADTQDEPQAVYWHLWWLASVLPFSVFMATAGRLSEALLRGRRFASIPAFTREGYRLGQVGRQCTRDYKVRVVERTIRRTILGLRPRQRVPAGVRLTSVFGISTDEAGRAVRIRRQVEHRGRHVAAFPLIELGWSRADCIRYLADRVPHEVPRSACVYCPYKSNAEWRRLRDTDAEGWGRAVELDDGLRANARAARGLGGQLFVHVSRRPLRDADLNDDQMTLGFAAECQGMCGQ